MTVPDPAPTKLSPRRPPLSEWVEAILKLAYPPRCLFCRSLLAAETAEPLCRRCRPYFSQGGMLCLRCEQFYCLSAPCACPAAPEGPLEGMFALSRYEGEWRRMLHRLKFEGQRQLARPLGRWLGGMLQETGWPLGLVVPLPLHHRREARRGFNQAELIGRHAARALGLPLSTMLVKTRATPPQTGLSRSERRANVAGVFALGPAEPRAGAVLLLDDIYSTGATLREAAAVLHQRGFLVYGAVIAYNPRLF